MSTGKIIQSLGVAIALVAGVMGGFDLGVGGWVNDTVVVAVLGVAGGYFIAEDDRSRFLIGAVALALVAQGALGSIPGVGMFISQALEGLSGLFNAAAVTVIVLTTIDKLKP